ncbi:MAG: GntR family transcriptional regulator [Spirochaetales bacterium]|nr:GntR family transcriptional regulator [Spirochaetales bacterium]
MLPRYQEIINNLHKRILGGEFGEEGKLPSEAQLMSEFETSRITVTRALQELELKGIIYKIKGKGSFVSRKRKSGEESRIISLVLPHKEDFFSGGQQYVRGVYKSCQERGYLCSVHYSEQSSRKEKQILEEISQHQVAGAIIYPISNRNINQLSRLNISGFPLVLLDRRLKELDLPVVISNNFEGALELVTYLTEMDHRRIGFVGAMDSEAVSRRYQGYCRALVNRKIPLDSSVVFSKFNCGSDEDQQILCEEEATTILTKLLTEGATAVFCVNDLIAYRMLKAARDLGLSVPEDLSIAGFDNMRYFSESNVELTTEAQDYEAICRGCVSLLLEIIEKGPEHEPEPLIIPTTFIPGNTVRRVKKI